MNYQAGNQQQPKTYSDFIFWNRATLKVLEIDSMPTEAGPGHAQALAQRHGVTVSFAIVQEYFIEPVRCDRCGLVLPESGPCWHDLFAEEETDAEPEILKAN